MSVCDQYDVSHSFSFLILSNPLGCCSLPGQAVDVVCCQPDEQAVALLAKESWDRCSATTWISKEPKKD